LTIVPSFQQSKWSDSTPTAWRDVNFRKHLRFIYLLLFFLRYSMDFQLYNHDTDPHSFSLAHSFHSFVYTHTSLPLLYLGLVPVSSVLPCASTYACTKPQSGRFCFEVENLLCRLSGGGKDMINFVVFLGSPEDVFGGCPKLNFCKNGPYLV
jgi:hypothetical protein